MKKSVLPLFGLIVIVSGWWMISQNTQPQFEQDVVDVWVTLAEDSEQLQTLSDRFTQTTGMPVNVRSGIKASKVMSMLDAADTPDVILLSTADLVQISAQQNLIETIDPWIASESIDLDDFYPASLKQCTMPDGTLVCLPWSSDIQVLLWNKDLFEAAGLDPDQSPETMEALVQYAERLTVRNVNGDLTQAGFIPDYTRSHLDLYARMFGGFWTDEDGTVLTVNTKPVADALQWQQQFYDIAGADDLVKFESSLTPYANSPHRVYAGKPLACQQCHRYLPEKNENIPDWGFYNGDVAMMVGGPWQVGNNYIPSLKPSLNYGVAPFPAPADHPEQANTSVMQGVVVLIPAGAQDKSSAAEFLAWLLSPEIMAEATFERGSLPTRRTAVNDARFQQLADLAVFIDLLEDPNAMPYVNTLVDPDLNSALSKLEAEVLHRGAEPIQGLDQLQAEYGPMLKDLWEE